MSSPRFKWASCFSIFSFICGPLYEFSCFCFANCIACPLVYDFWLPLWYLQTFLAIHSLNLSVIVQGRGAPVAPPPPLTWNPGSAPVVRQSIVSVEQTRVIRKTELCQDETNAWIKQWVVIICNQCLSLSKLCVIFQFMAKCTRYNIISYIATRIWGIMDRDGKLGIERTH
jgi:hypothetical protein